MVRCAGSGDVPVKLESLDWERLRGVTLPDLAAVPDAELVRAHRPPVVLRPLLVRLQEAIFPASPACSSS